MFSLSHSARNLLERRLHTIYNHRSTNVYYKSTILKALLTQDAKLLQQLMVDAGLVYQFYDKPFTSLGAGETILTSHWHLSLVTSLLQREAEANLLSILTHVFHNIPEATFCNQRTITFSMYYKKQLFSALCKDLEKSKKHYILSMLGDLSFDPKLPTLSLFKVSTKPRTDVDFFAMGLDVSEYIIMATSYLKSQNSISRKTLQQLYVHYHFVEYSKALELIKQQLLKCTTQESKNILDCAATLREFDHIKNDPRRFYETRLAQYLNGLILKSNHTSKKLSLEVLDSVNRILSFYFGSTALVKTPRDMEYQIARFAQGYKDTSKFSSQEIEFIKSLRKSDRVIFKGSDRVSRSVLSQLIERKFETSASKVGANAWNSSGGLLKATSPTFFDGVCRPARNMLADVTAVAPKNGNKEQWYWNHDRHYTSYVGSISGHTCEVVGMLVRYMKHHQYDKTLQRDLHLFLVQLLAVYAKRGYHSFLEVIDVLHDPPMQELFKQYGVTIDLYDYFSREEMFPYLEHAMDDALMYTQGIVCKRDVGRKVALMK